MFVSVSKSAFRDYFHRAGRGDQFSYEALGLIFDYLEESTEDEAGIELDVVAICCEYAESDESDIRSDYSLDDDEDVEEYLQNNTSFIGKTSDDKFVYAKF